MRQTRVMVWSLIKSRKFFGFKHCLNANTIEENKFHTLANFLADLMDATFTKLFQSFSPSFPFTAPATNKIHLSGKPSNIGQNWLSNFLVFPRWQTFPIPNLVLAFPWPFCFSWFGPNHWAFPQIVQGQTFLRPMVDHHQGVHFHSIIFFALSLCCSPLSPKKYGPPRSAPCSVIYMFLGFDKKFLIEKAKTPPVLIFATFIAPKCCCCFALCPFVRVFIPVFHKSITKLPIF